MKDVLAFAHEILREVLREGDTAIDATIGNGYDTVFLAKCVGAGGRIFGFDIQEEALAATQERLEAVQALASVELLRKGHEEMVLAIPHDLHGKIQAIIFNLGYLPGGDKTIITRPDNTVAALTQALNLLASGGMITVVCYPGHSGGREEAERVEDWARALDSDMAEVLSYRFVKKPNAPRLLVLKKYKEMSS